MLATARTFAIEGVRARAVVVEVDIRPGLPGFAIVGLAGAAVREARDRVRAAILNSGFEFPAQRITANLAPADVPKAGPGLDLALACAVLAASGQVAPERLASHALFGELSLDGRVRPSHGTLAVAEATHKAALRMLLLAPGRAHEARLVPGVAVGVVQTLQSAARVLGGGEPDPLPPAPPDDGRDERAARLPELCDVRGRGEAVEALTIAAAGGHNLLLSGPPGTGKTMLAQRLPSILPPLSEREALEVLRIHSVCDGRAGERLPSARPFRAPHHTITTAGLIGGARGSGPAHPGEAVLAHNGVLFLDELSEFARPTLEALRQPLEEGRVAIARARYSCVYPARFMLVAATNPCPCGYAGERARCACRPSDLARHRRRLSGPLLDRVDLLVQLRRGGSDHMTGSPAPRSAEARARVLAARERAIRRSRGDGGLLNGRLDAAALRRHAALDAASETLLVDARDRGLLSARGVTRVLRVARTVADLAGSERVRGEDLAKALSLRAEVVLDPGDGA